MLVLSTHSQPNLKREFRLEVNDLSSDAVVESKHNPGCRLPVASTISLTVAIYLARLALHPIQRALLAILH